MSRQTQAAAKPRGSDLLTSTARLVALCLLCSLLACAPVSTPTPAAIPTSAPTAPQATSTLVFTTPTAPGATATATPEPPDREDAFQVDYFPWAGSPPLPSYTGEGKAKVVNAIFFADPPFFGLDINPPEGWYHVVGSEVFATLDGQPISPMLDPQWQPQDGDRILLHGHVREQFITASYLAISGSPPFYYRSLLHADELQPDVLPPAYDGLSVWVRGELDVTEARGHFYELHEGASLQPEHIGKEAIVSGQLVFGESITVYVSGEIFVRENGAHVRIFDGSSWPVLWPVSHRGTIAELDPSSTSLWIERSDGARVEARFDTATRFRFADGSMAPMEALSPGQVIQMRGQASDDASMSATELTIIAVEPAGQPHAVFVPADGNGLWSMALDDGERRLLLNPPQGHPGCNLARARLSPDGRTVVVECADGENTYLMTAELQNEEWRQWLAGEDWNESHPAWSPDAQRIVFCRYEMVDGQLLDAGLWALSLHDGDVRQIAPAAAEGLRTVMPQWSPDGKQVAYGHVATSDQGPATLYVLTFPQENKRILDEAREWRWSPDATQLLVARQAAEGARSRLWIVQRDGTSLTWLSITGVNDRQGRWSPDGRRIAFLSRPWPSEGPDRLCLMQADGMRRFQPLGRPFASSVSWSGDGQHILFLRLDQEARLNGLWMVRSDGAGSTQLAEDAVALLGCYTLP